MGFAPFWKAWGIQAGLGELGLFTMLFSQLPPANSVVPGTLLYTTDLGLVSSNGTNWFSYLGLFTPSPAEIAAGVPVNTSYYYGDLRRYGCVLDGVTDCVAGLVNACKVGGFLFCPGDMALASFSLAALPNQAVALLPGTTMQGFAGYTCTITGSTPCNVFWSVNAKDISVLDFGCTGNGINSGNGGVGPPTNTGYFWYLQCNAAATGQMGNVRFERNALKNFCGLYWVYVDNTAAVTFPFLGFRAQGNTFTSQAGNNQGPTQITNTANVFGFSGSDTVTTFFTIADVELHDNVAYGAFIKMFAIFWSGVTRAKVYSNTLVGFGTDAGTSDDTGCYALAAYDHSHGTGLLPDEIEFYDNTIDGVRDCGVYTAGVNRIVVNGNRISGQTSLANGTLPKGGIALNAASFADCIGNTFYNCVIGISVAQNPTPTNGRVNVLQNTVHTVPTNGTGVWLSGTSAGNAPAINVDGISVDSIATGTRGVHLVFTTAVGINNLSIQNFDIAGVTNGIDLFSPFSDVPTLGNVRIGRGRFRNIPGNNLQWLNATNPITRATFESIDFMNMITGATGLYMVNAANVTVRALTFYELSSGGTFCWYGSGAQGRVEGVRFVNVATGNKWSGAASELGVSVPAFTGGDNDFIQDLNSFEVGTAGSKYTRQGFQWDRAAVAWKEVRCLTGN